MWEERGGQGRVWMRGNENSRKIAPKCNIFFIMGTPLGGYSPLSYILGECYYVTFALWHAPSVCRLFVTLMHSRRRLELFGIIIPPPISSGSRTVCVKIWGKNSKRQAIVQVRWYGKLAFFDQHLFLFRKQYIIIIY